MNKLSTLFTYCIAISLFFCSCEGSTTFTKTIVNNSSETLTVTAFSSTNTSNILGTITIIPNDQKQVYWDNQQGKTTTANYSCIEELDSIVVSVSNNRTLTLDLMNASNWIKESSEAGKEIREDCTVTISDTDIQ